MSNRDKPKDCSQSQTASHENLEENEKALSVTLSIQWLEDDNPNRRKFILETSLQTWASTLKNRGKLTCEVLGLSEDGSLVRLSIRPPPDLSELGALKGQTLGKDRKRFKVTSVSWEGDDRQTPQNDVMRAPPPPPPEPQHERVATNEDGSAVFMAGNENSDIFMVLTSIYSEEVKSIEKRNNCVMKIKVIVEFEKDKGGGDPQKALSEFKTYVHRLEGGSAVPSRRSVPEELDMRATIDKPEEHFQLDQSFLEQHKPSPNIKTVEVFNGGAHPVEVPEASLWTCQQTTGDVKMDIDDPPFSGGITIEENVWLLMTTYYYEHLLKVQKKFNVQLDVERRGHGKVRIRAVSGRNAALESHAVRAFAHLYKKTFTLFSTTIPPGGATGFTRPAPPKWDGREPLLNGQSVDSAVTKQAMLEAAAGGGGGGAHEEDNCPICLDVFIDKRRLGCKHEFCRGCLDKSVESLGPCCPVCKQVFGAMVGNQPEGTMTSTIVPKALPGFPNCDTIVISYSIPNGIQTEKHPNPGMWFHGIQRKAFLPNNQEGKKVLQLLRRAFEQKLIFTVGQSRTTSAENQVTWNDIHHKTSMESGPTRFGYPDPDYLRRVRDELKAKGIE